MPWIVVGQQGPHHRGVARHAGLSAPRGVDRDVHLAPEHTDGLPRKGVRGAGVHRALLMPSEKVEAQSGCKMQPHPSTPLALECSCGRNLAGAGVTSWHHKPLLHVLGHWRYRP